MASFCELNQPPRDFPVFTSPSTTPRLSKSCSPDATVQGLSPLAVALISKQHAMDAGSVGFLLAFLNQECLEVFAGFVIIIMLLIFFLKGM